MSEEMSMLLGDVVRAMENLNRHFDEKIEALREKGTDTKEIQNLLKGSHAMKDASGIYLAWANHYLTQLGKGLESTEEEEIISEV